MTLKSLTVWERIKQEFEPETHVPYFCSRSPTFKALWDVYNRELKDLAREFLESRKSQDFVTGFMLLFSTSKSVHETPDEIVRMHRKVRLDFLEWMLERLVKEASVPDITPQEYEKRFRMP